MADLLGQDDIDAGCLLEAATYREAEADRAVQHAHNRSLYSRIHHRLEITALTPDDTTEYLRMRLARAGCKREIFASDAIVILHEATLGAMRDLDRLAAHALRETRAGTRNSSSATS